MAKRERLHRGWLKIGELAKKLGLPISTLRYYTQIGLLPVIAETQGGYRLYDYKVAAQRIGQIQKMVGNRPTLKQTKELLEELN